MLGYNPHLSSRHRIARLPSYRSVVVRPLPLCLQCALALVVGVVLAVSAVAQNQSETESKLAKTRSELKGVAKERQQLESQRGDATRRLRQVDEQVARSARDLSQIEDKLREQEQALLQTQAQRERMQQGLAEQRRQLAALLRAAYEVGDSVPLKLLLSQDSVADANRLLIYYRYVQRARAERIAVLTQELQGLVELEHRIAGQRQTLEQTRRQQVEQASVLKLDRQKQVKTVAELNTRYQERSTREKVLGQNAKALEQLLANLRAAAARAEAERREAARRVAAQAALEAKSGHVPTKIPPKVITNLPGPKVGGLSWPVTGNLLASYGGTLPDGRTSKGVLIGAPVGNNVVAVADGMVVFAEWMTGYGMILIVDHGNGYMSLYAHNDTLLRNPGTYVKRGESVAKVGQSGGQGMPALYFELRHNGQPIDPLSWLQRR
ncbi:murein hydrolase activator EnvC [Xylella taiwanensis]|uniref:Murein hydrolase activator EnvC n=1 Tax=Xylella taiwanensis TaxID=1444770 RepID=A0ABS8TTM7_9GAMM|nr:murein hydrolase activator EnvC [Xylella taiwanensis]AXI84373.1 peptidase M23 [Xylella taiwanensis]MCD8457494.1 murein hydrolase activator EnvC [Xylella taiwanensis]MCD8457653.1 murein hydrolase activator EnvC [Xylella taiwanensis]MCD8461222.1 murein hydrolase activator EnvC [Xylella taiwanensis]MCD8462742.1 murein hydrolase activator EnvC [Xylella taiwanensis]